MKAIVVTPKNDSEFKFLSDLLEKLGISSSELSYEDLEDIGMSKLLRDVDKTKKASRAEVMKKLSS
jgi:reverse gyrase